jgi:hypothetical protein
MEADTVPSPYHGNHAALHRGGRARGHTISVEDELEVTHALHHGIQA